MKFFGFSWLLLSLSLASLKAQPLDAFFSTLSTRDGLPSNLISAVAQDKNNFLWIGTGNGLCRYDGYNFKVFKKGESQQTLIDNEISALLVDGNYLWIGTWRGLSRIHTITFEVERIALQEREAIRALFKDRNENLWIGTANGLLKYSSTTKNFTRFSAEDNGLSHNTIRYIHEDQSGNLWVGSMTN